MVKVLGFDDSEETVIIRTIGRFGQDSRRICGLKRIEKADLPGYDGKVVPQLVEGSHDDLEMTMYLSACNPFTVAHELAHVSDIGARRKETMDNIACRMPTNWHVAHRMSAEYFANRLACDYAEEQDIFRAWKSDHTGMIGAVKGRDWAQFLIYYSLILGIFHGMKRMDCEPLSMVPAGSNLPDEIVNGAKGFKEQALTFFDGHAALAPAAGSC